MFTKLSKIFMRLPKTSLYNNYQMLGVAYSCQKFAEQDYIIKLLERNHFQDFGIHNDFFDPLIFLKHEKDELEKLGSLCREEDYQSWVEIVAQMKNNDNKIERRG